MSAASPELIKKYNVRSLPYVLLFFNGQPLYGGPMGGPKIVSLPTNSRIVNVLIADPDAASQQHAERHLRLKSEV
jgi:thioredoxin-like negative regulator of GroEL